MASDKTAMFLLRKAAAVRAQTKPVGPYPSLGFSYLPATDLEMEVHYASVRAAKSPEEHGANYLAFLMAHVKSWDVKDESGAAVELTSETMKLLPRDVGQQIYACVVDSAVQLELNLKN